MKTTLIFGGESRERLVSVATAQSIARTLSEADLWFWDMTGEVFETSRDALFGHENPFIVPFKADGAALGSLDRALDQAKNEARVLVVGMHGGASENGEFQVKCETRGIAFTGSGSLSSHLAFDKVSSKLWVRAAGVETPSTIALEDMEEALERYGALFAKPCQDGSSYGLIKVQSHNDIAAVRKAALETLYLVEPCIIGQESTCGVVELDGQLIALPPVEIIPAEGAFDYEAKYLAASTQEICPARFAPDVMAAIQAKAITAHKTLGCYGYSRTDFIISAEGPIYIETNTLPGMTQSSLLPKSLKAQEIDFEAFLRELIAGAIKRRDHVRI